MRYRVAVWGPDAGGIGVEGVGPAYIEYEKDHVCEKLKRVDGVVLEDLGRG